MRIGRLARGIVILITIFIYCKICGAQDSVGYLLRDKRSNCAVWRKHSSVEDSISWKGGCKNNLASGRGIMISFTNSKRTSKYVGGMLNGKPHGYGIYTFGGTGKLKGYFSNGEPLFLRKVCLNHLHKNVVSRNDSNQFYVGDDNLRELYYYALVPDGKVRGAVVLMPGTWETTEHLLSSTKTLCELAYKNNLAVIALSINQRITFTDELRSLVNTMIGDAMDRYTIPENKVVIGGWSMGGLFSLRYTELANQFPDKTRIKPVAVFSCDGPCDLLNIYSMFKNKLRKDGSNSEAKYGIEELTTYCGGSPLDAKDSYIYYSCYTHSQEDGGNAQYLLNTPVRIYNDLDANWWMENRGLDMYYMNGLDQTAMIQLLHDKGNLRAEFINAYKKGYRIEGNRHPHSWSIVEPENCIRWMLDLLR